MQNKFDFDYIIIGSGFGGSVAAHRLTEKGYRVAVLEAGKRFGDKDFAKSTWNFRKYFWAPIFRGFGILRMTIFKDVFVLSGAGVGGGSLVYANTLLVPKEKIWSDPQWAALNNWVEVMPKFYAAASAMLGVTTNPYLSPSDQLLKKTATKLNLPFYPTEVGVYFGQPGVTTSDPYFQGQGPERTGCTLCGACMVGCRDGGKNTLVKNYLYFAEKNGAKIFPETFVTQVQPLDSHDGSQGYPDGGHGYKVIFQNSTKLFSLKSGQLTAKGVVFSAGVLGTLKLLLSCQQKGALSKLSFRLGEMVRTNSESILGIRDSSFDMGQGVAIGSGIYIDEHTHIEAVRYPKGSDALSLLSTHLPVYTQGYPIVLSWILGFWRRPLQILKNLNPFGWAASTLILLVMQTVDNSLKIILKRNLFFIKTLQTKSNSGIKAFIPEAQKFVHALAGKTGLSLTTLTEIFLKIPTTAHILGGATMGLDAHAGVVNFKNEVFNYQNLYICDGSVISANLGVNPSLTIAALTEHAMSHIPANNICAKNNRS